jgi:hypothetical protein
MEDKITTAQHSIYNEDKKGILPILVMSALLGSGIGIAGAYFIH